MRVRDATPADAPAIANFWNPQILHSVVTFNVVPKPTEEIAGMIESRPCFMVAELDGQVCGFINYHQFRGGVGYAHTMEHTIILSPDAHGRGVGRALMTAACDHALANGVHSMIAGVCAENAPGVAFHRRLGFEVVATLPEVGRKFDRWMDLVLMQKRL